LRSPLCPPAPALSSSGLLTRVALSVVFGGICLTAARAQDAEAPLPPVRGLFGSDGAEPRIGQTAQVSAWLNVTHDSNLAAGLPAGRLDARTRPEGQYSVLGTDLSYLKRARRMTLGANVTSNLRHYPHLEDTIADHGAGVTWSSTFGRQTALSASQRLFYSQSYQLALLPALTADPVSVSSRPDSVSHLQALGLTTNFRVVRGVGRRSSVEGSYERRSVEFESVEADLGTWDARGHFSSRMTRNAVLQLGYGQRVGRYGGHSSGRTLRSHDVDVGMNYSRTFSLSESKQTTVSVMPGSSFVDSEDGLQYRLRGEAVLDQRLSRSWTAQGVYRRSLQFVEGFTEPFFANAVTGGLHGYLGRRVELVTSAGYSTGEIGLSGAGAYDSYSGSVQASVAMTRHWAVSLEYLFYDHRIAGDITLPGTLAGTLNRHSVRVGLRAWKRLLQ